MILLRQASTSVRRVSARIESSEDPGPGPVLVHATTSLWCSLCVGAASRKFDTVNGLSPGLTPDCAADRKRIG